MTGPFVFVSEFGLPLYDYQCKNCRTIAEVRHGFGDVYAEACANCGGVMARVFNPAGIVFKGSGFYITDSRKGGSSDSAPGAAPAAAAAAPAAASAGAPAAAAASPAPTPAAKTPDAA